VPQIEVTFDIDANGIVNVSAQDKATGKVHNITIQASGGLDETEIERMVKEGEDNSEQDKLKKEAVEARNQAESLIHSAEKTLSDLGEKADEKMKKDVENSVIELKSVIESENIEDIKTKTTDLSNVLMKLGEIAYKNSENAAENETANSSEEINKDDKKNEDVVDADFEEIKPEDDKKNAS
jgi:molecular chaperone DnaK